MVQQSIGNNNEADKEKNVKKDKLPKETIVKLEGMGFAEKEDKPGLYFKNTINDINFFWDFRKAKAGSAYASKIDGDTGGYESVPREDVEQMEEYTFFRPEKTGNKKTDTKTKAIVPASGKKADGLLRGSERDIIRLMDVGIQLDSIIDASHDPGKLGEGLLWHEMKFGSKTHVEPSAELVDLIAQDMGNITVKIVEFDSHIIEDPESMQKYLTYYCVAEATDNLTHTSGLGAAEQIIDFEEIRKQKRTFARTLVTRKACRNAVERLIPIPRKAMVFLIRKKLDEYSKKRKQ